MSRWPGRLITKNPVAPSGPGPTESAPGVWTLPEVAYWSRQGRWPSASADPYWSYVTYLLNTTATNAAQNNTFLDSSTNNFTITRNGNTTQGARTPYGTLWSNYFDGSGDYLTISSSAAFGYATGDFTIEFWMYLTGTQDQTIISNLSSASSTNPHIYYSAGTIRYYTASADRITSGSISLNQWYHVALTRASGSTKMFVNGAQAGSTYADSNNYGTSAPLGIATYWSGGSPVATNTFTGYMSNARIVKGTAVYTAAFTPPAAPLTAISGTSLLTCQSNRFIDSSSNALAITPYGPPQVTAFSPFVLAPPGYNTTDNSGSAYFDGTGDYLTSTGGTASAMGSGDFSFEAFVYWTAYPTQYTSIFSTRSTNNANAAAFTVGVESSGYVYAFSNAFIAQTASSVFSLNAWNHVVFTRSGTTARLFVNGVLRATGSNSQNFTDQGFAIGANRDGTEQGAGYVSNLRLVKGSIPTAYQTSSTTVGATIFTPPTAPVTAISGTSILCNFTNAGLYDVSMNNNAETIGNAQVSTGQAKFGTTSAYFDGSGDVLNSPAGPQFNFGTGDFTVEFWMYKTSSTAYQRMIAYGPFGGAGNFQVEATDDTTLTVHVNGGYVTTTVPSLLNNWVYVAVTRQSGSVRVFTNGTLRSTNTQAGNISQTNPFSVGAVYDASSPYTGYLDEVRVTRGYARYTATFTAPTAPFPIF